MLIPLLFLFRLLSFVFWSVVLSPLLWEHGLWVCRFWLGLVLLVALMLVGVVMTSCRRMRVLCADTPVFDNVVLVCHLVEICCGLNEPADPVGRFHEFAGPAWAQGGGLWIGFLTSCPWTRSRQIGKCVNFKLRARSIQAEQEALVIARVLCILAREFIWYTSRT